MFGFFYATKENQTDPEKTKDTSILSHQNPFFFFKVPANVHTEQLPFTPAMDTFASIITK